MDMPSGRKPPCVKGAGKRLGVLGRREKGGCFVCETSLQTIRQRFAWKWTGACLGAFD